MPTDSTPQPREAPRTPPVLVVDDELGYREGIRRILHGRGYTATTAADGAAALALASEREFPIVLVDLKMPGIDGFELIRRVRELRPDTLCIVVSAFATIESAVQTTKMGAFDFVVKPFVPDDLMVVVRRAADSWRLAEEARRLRAEREAHLLELSAEQSRLRTIVQHMGDGLLVINIDGDIVLDNPVARRLLGAVGLTALRGPLAGHLPDAQLGAAVRELLEGGRADIATSLEVSLSDPAAVSAASAMAVRTLRATLNVLPGAGAHPLGVVVMLTDITESKALEVAKTRFVTMVAHELKAPIAAVEGYLHLMQQGAFESEPDRLRTVSARCLERTGALLGLIGDLLEITRRDAGAQPRQLELLPLGPLVYGLVEFHRVEAADRGIELRAEPYDEELAVLADRAELERVVTNLLSNAIKYGRPGGAAMVAVRRDGGAVVLEVRDTGIGMSPEEVARFGEEFFRAKNADTRQVTGTGLGIALVKKIVESYNGQLEVESERAVGSVVRVLLPAPGRSGPVVGPTSER